MLEAAGIDVDGMEDSIRLSRVAQATGTLLKAAGVAAGTTSWADQSDESILAQGRSGGRFNEAMEANLRRLPGLFELVSEPGAMLLGVGTGAGFIAVAMAESLPGTRVVGIDVLPRALKLAAATVAASPAADRIEVRLQDVAELTEIDRYAYAWLPAPFIPQDPLREGVRRVARAVVPGGWVALGHGRYDGTALDNAVARFQTQSYGGTALDDDQAEAMLTDAGLTHVSSPPMPTGAPSITFGQRPR